jgi:hypothetical protein
MKSVKELRKREAERVEKKARMYSTSEGRANFAEALESAQVEHAVVGFDRYGRPLAALVPIDAVRMLAGAVADVDPALRDKITRAARLFLANVPGKSTLSVAKTKVKVVKVAKKKKSGAAARAKARRTVR